MKKQKLLIAVHQLNIGGVQKSLISALHALDYDRFDVTLYVRKDRTDLLPQVDGRVGKIIVNDDTTRYYRKPKAVALAARLKAAELAGGDTASARKALDEFVISGQTAYEKARWFPDTERYDIAVSYIQGRTAEFVAKHVPAGRKVMFFHGSVDEYHDLHEKIFPLIDRIAAVNAECRDILRGLYPAFAEKIFFVRNYVDPEYLRSAASEYAVDRGGNDVVLCTCGRFTRVKGFDLAVGAAKLLKERGIGFRWYFAGDGPERAALEAMISEYRLGDQVILTGMLNNPYPYIAACDIYVQPSREESYGLAVKEAQILGRPVVSTGTVGGAALLEGGKRGILTPVTAEGLADGMEELIKDPELRSRFAKAYTKSDSLTEKSRYSAELSGLLDFGSGG